MSDQSEGAPDSVAAEAGVPIEPVSGKSFKVVAIVAGVLFAPQVLAHLILPYTMLPTFQAMFDSMGGTLPAPTALLMRLGPVVGIVMVAIDALVFWFFYRLARKYWIGLLFAPLLAGGLLAVPLVTALYLPMFEVINLVQ